MLELGSNAGVYVHGDARLDVAARRLVAARWDDRPGVRRHASEFTFTATCSNRSWLVWWRPGAGRGGPDERTHQYRAEDGGRGRRRAASRLGSPRRWEERTGRGGRRQGATVWPTILADVDESMKVVCEEVFGPVVSVMRVDSPEEADPRINASKYGLNAGVFAQDIQVAFHVARSLHVGAVGDQRQLQVPHGQHAFRRRQVQRHGRERPRRVSSKCPKRKYT